MSPARPAQTKRHTIREVAARAGVSVATVSHVINGSHYVSPELTQRVLDAIRDLEYVPNKVARALTRQAIPLLALIVPDISNPYWSCVARSVQDVTDRHGFSVIVCSSDGLLEREVRFLQSLSGWISGLIFHPYHATPQHVSASFGRTVPVVILGDLEHSETLPPNWDRVFSNNEDTAHAAVDHLLALGHRRIAFIMGEEDAPSGIRRLAGYRRALEGAGLPLIEELVVPGHYTQNGGRQAMAQLLDLPLRPSAVFCANDLSALGALGLARERGLRVPDDISIVGLDDIDEAVQASPPLTTMRQAPREVGRVIAETLVERLLGRSQSVSIGLPGELIIRQSSGPPPST
jgi:LacI family transcriptional regulator